MPAVDPCRRSAISASLHRPITSVVHEKAKPTRHRLTLQDKLDVIEFCEQNQGRLSQADMATTLRACGYGTIVQSTISTWLDQKDKLREQAKNPNELSFKHRRQSEFPDVDKALQAWILQKQGRNLGITGHVIRAKAREFAKEFGYPSDFLSLSNGWLGSLVARMGLRQHRYHGEAASAPIDTLADEIAWVRGLIARYAPRDTFNFDECALFYRLPSLGRLCD